MVYTMKELDGGDSIYICIIHWLHALKLFWCWNICFTRFIEVNTKGIHMLYSHKHVVVVKDLRWRSNQNKSCRFQKLCNIVVDNVFVWNHLSNENYIWILTFEFWIFQMTSDGETTKTKVVDLKKLCNFVVDNFFIWNNLLKENYGQISSHLKFKFFKRPRMEKGQRPKL
jgi:hypothetical protein